MGPLPHDPHRVAVGNSDRLQAAAAPGRGCAQAPGATARPTAAGGAPRAAAAAVTRRAPDAGRQGGFAENACIQCRTLDQWSPPPGRGTGSVEFLKLLGI